MAAAWLGLGCGRLIGIDSIAYTPDAGSEAETRDAPPESTSSDREMGLAGDVADGGFESSVDASADVSDGPTCDLSVTQSDKRNCGRCGHDCLGGECKGGRCASVLIAGALASPRAIAAPNDGFVYWVDSQDGTVRKAPKTPSVLPKTLGTSSLPGMDIAVDDAYVYFTTYAPPGTSTGGLSRVPKDGSGLIEVVTSQFGGVRGLAIDDQHAFYAVEDEPTMLIRTTKGMTDATVLYRAPPTDADVTPGLFAIAIDDQYVYATDVGSSLVVRIRQDSENVYPPTIFGGTRSRPYAIRVAGDFVYWADSAAVYRRSRLDATDMGNPISPASFVDAIAVDGMDVYFADQIPQGLDPPLVAIRRIRKDAKFGIDMATDVTEALWSNIRSIAVDDVAIYFTADDSVLKVAK
jgi:hypothetical protein